MDAIRIEDMTREEFVGLLKRIFDVTDCEKTHDELIDQSRGCHSTRMDLT